MTAKGTGKAVERARKPHFFGALLDDAAGDTRRRVIGIYVLLLTINVAAWGFAILAFRLHPVLLGTALLAYSFGLRHAVDADHIAAIDNVTRKLMQEGKRPVAVGLMFSLGHSTIVFIGSAILAVTALSLQHRVESARHFGGLVGALVSASVLFGIATVNIFVLRSIYSAFRRVRRGGRYADEDFDLMLNGRGFLARFFRPMFALIRESSHMYPLGILFGLGFDTATEIGLLGISASEASKGLPIGPMLVFPVLFAAGMCLIDTTDNILMLGAYGWAFIKPIRKLYYNMTITFVSVVVAFFVGGIESLGLFSDQLHPVGWFWRILSNLNGNFTALGFAIVGLFVASWIASVLFYRWRRYEEEPKDLIAPSSGPRL